MDQDGFFEGLEGIGWIKISYLWMEELEEEGCLNHLKLTPDK